MLRFLFIITIMICALPHSGFAQRAPKADQFLLGGIQVNEADYDRWATTVKAVGMNTIEVTVYAKQGDWDSDNLWWDKQDEGVIREVRAAKKAGLKVVLILRVALDHAFERNKFLWHGMIMPKSRSLLTGWFDRYQMFSLKWARIAAAEEIDVLVLGSELNALAATVHLDRYPDLIRYYSSSKKQSLVEKRALKFEENIEEKDLWVRGFDNYKNLEEYIDDRIRVNKEWAHQVGFGLRDESLGMMNERRQLIQERWINIIKATRKTFEGQLSYAANFDNYHEVGFWSQLDFMGINAYFPLRDASQMNLTSEQMQSVFEESWNDVFDDITSFKEDQGLEDFPMLFTELGYIYRRNTSIEPWKGFGFSVVGSFGKEQLIVWGEEPIDRKERALAVNALYNVVIDRKERLRGILYWKLTSHDYHIPVEPFVLHIAPKGTDPLQQALARFRSLR